MQWLRWVQALSLRVVHTLKRIVHVTHAVTRRYTPLHTVTCRYASLIGGSFPGAQVLPDDYVSYMGELQRQAGGALFAELLWAELQHPLPPPNDPQVHGVVPVHYVGHLAHFLSQLTVYAIDADTDEDGNPSATAAVSTRAPPTVPPG